MTEAGAGRYQSQARLLARPVMKALWPAEVEGIENVPTEGPALIAPNHISFIDSIFVLALMPRRTLAVGKAEYMDSWKTRYLFPAIGMIPLDRSGGSASEAALEQAAASLEQGDLFLIYPEGTRSRDGYLHRGRTGVARLAVRTGAPIVPVGIRGTDAIQPPGAVLPRPFRPCGLRFGPPIEVERYRGREVSRAALRELTDEVMYEISLLSGQNYVDAYGNEQPADETGSPAPVGAVPSEVAGG
jgi:1-acyl-sn-glycerol-3-phosphate acyltransferase